MTTPQAILSVGALIAAALYFGLSARDAAAQRGGAYTLVAHHNATLAPGVFRMDMGSGGVSYCVARGSAAEDTRVFCSPQVE